MVNPWFKFYASEYLSDPKIGYLTPQERSCWITLLCLAGTSSTGGIIEYLTVEVLLEKSGIHYDPYYPDEWNNCLSVLTKFEKMKMITKKDDGSIEIINWVKRQETSLTNAERQAKYRQNKKVTHVTTEVTLEKNRIEKNKDIELPIWLNKKAWDAWVQYRKEKKKSLTPLSMKMQLKFLEENKEDHTQIIRNSITNGWTGLFPIKKDGFQQKKPPRFIEPSTSKEDNDRRNFLSKQSEELAGKFKV